MDLKRLRSFVAVAELGSVSAAAEKLRITQPALSRQLQDLHLIWERVKSAITRTGIFRG